MGGHLRLRRIMQHVVVDGQDPSGQTVEVSIQEYWIVPGASNVTIEGFTLKHAANRAQIGGVSNNGYDNY